MTAAAARAEPATRRQVRRICLDVLHRTPDPMEWRVLVGAPVALVAQRMLGLREAMEQWLEEELHHFLLLDRFRPDTDAVRTIPERLGRGSLDVRGATREIVLSTGFALRNPGNDTFVTVLLEQCLGITVQDRRHRRLLAAGKRMYDGHRERVLGREGASQSDIVGIVLEDRGFARHLLDRHHRRLLGAPLPARDPEADALVGRVHAEPETFFDVLAGWLASETYHDRPLRRMTDRQFVRSLYGDLLGRRPTFEEMRNVRNALQSMAEPAPLQTVLVKVLLDSGQCVLPDLEPGGEDEFVQACFRRFLARDPGPDEAETYASSLREGEADAELVVRALAGSVSYHYY